MKLVLLAEFIALNQQLIEKIYASDSHFSLAVTGGGTSAISALFGVAGASGTMLEATVPYHEASLSRYTSSSSQQGCNSYTARAMAMTAYLRAREYAPGKKVFGVGCTAAIATNRQRRGADRCHIAVQGERATTIYDIELSKKDGRPEQETNCAEVLLESMAVAAGLLEPEQVPGASTKQMNAEPSWQKLLAGNVRSTASSRYKAVFPGAFNPLHDGHRAMMEVARYRYGDNIALELSIRNVDKPPLDYLTMAERQTDEFEMVFTDAPTFAEKSELFPGSSFIVGLDTVARIDNPKYYGSMEARDQALDEIHERGNRFLVFGRLRDGEFMTLKDITLSESLAQMCDEVTEQEFRMDISSTEIRRSQ